MNCTESDTNCKSFSPSQIYEGILGQAITGELVGMLNFARLAECYPEFEEKMEAIEHSMSERGHAQAFLNCGKVLQVDPLVTLEAPYWKKAREVFLSYAEQGNHTACILIQELMLESFAVSLYEDVSQCSSDLLRRTFGSIAAEEKEHLRHAILWLSQRYAQDHLVFEALVHEIHEALMPVLAEMVSKQDRLGPCGLCRYGCIKAELGTVDLDMGRLRGRAMQRYLQSLDSLGLPGERSLQWVATLPA